VTPADAPEAPRAPARSHGRLAVRATAAPRPLIEDAPVLARAWRACVLTIFPGLFPGPLGESLTGKALQEGVWSLEALDIRGFARDKHRSVDGPPAGGGPGMVMRPDVVAAALDHAVVAGRDARPLLAMSPRGRPFTQERARALAAGPGVVILCGRFEGIDQRVLDARGVEEVSVGDFVMTGGEIPAMAVIDAAVRLLPGVLGNAASVVEESFGAGLLEAPCYTRPADWEGLAIPEVLLSGHHARVADWRRSQSEALTKARRPDLWRAHVLRTMGGPAGEPEQSDATQSAGTGGREKDDQG
jgi:tRNA (guanine37-N1)-methyltransferase